MLMKCDKPRRATSVFGRELLNDGYGLTKNASIVNCKKEKNVDPEQM